MGYKSIADWRDLTDGHLYANGDVFPHDGRVIPEARIAELSGPQNKAGFALIKAIEVKAEEEHAEKAERPAKATRSRKK